MVPVLGRGLGSAGPSRRALYQPKEPKLAARSIPDQAFNELFAALDCNRDRALIAFYISTGARASELLGVCQGVVVAEEQVIGVVRKGSRAFQQLPASTDAFVSLRLYQQEMRDLVPSGAAEALWWTLRRLFRPLTYDAMRMVFNKANVALGANLTLHDLRHSAAKRMVRNPDLTLADVQWVLGRAHITTTEIYTNADMALKEQAIARTVPPNTDPARYQVSDDLLASSNSSDPALPKVMPRSKARQPPNDTATALTYTIRTAGLPWTSLPGSRWRAHGAGRGAAADRAGEPSGRGDQLRQGLED